MEIEIRDLTEEDLDDVCMIEEASFSMPWKKEHFRDLVYNDDAVYLVILLDKRIVGCAGYTDAVGEGYVNNVVISEEVRGMGLGRKLMEAVIESGHKRGINDFTLEVRVSNDPAVNLYKSLGFESAGIRKNFYEKPTEDAYVMWKH